MRRLIRALSLIAVAFAVAACDTPQNYMQNTGGPAARSLANLGWEALVPFIAATVVTWALIVWLALRRRGTLDEHAPLEADPGRRWIVIGGIAIPVAVLLILFISMLDSLAAFPMAHASGTAPEIRVRGRQWWFDAEYHPRGEGQNVHVPGEIHIPVGRPVEIELQSEDVIHSFWIPKLHGKMDLVPGQRNFIRIEASQPGRYEGECAEYCGAQHAHMRFAIIAEPPQKYRAWLAHQRASAAAPSNYQAAHGREVFMSSACPICHTIRGTPAQGRVGPELTHVGSRKRIAGDAFENNTANLAAWITSAQSMKPGSQMPNFTQFSGPDLQALTAYLRGLR